LYTSPTVYLAAYLQQIGYVCSNENSQNSDWQCVIKSYSGTDTGQDDGDGTPPASMCTAGHYNFSAYA